jgi:hypothetical protein
MLPVNAAEGTYAYELFDIVVPVRQIAFLLFRRCDHDARSGIKIACCFGDREGFLGVFGSVVNFLCQGVRQLASGKLVKC